MFLLPSPRWAVFALLLAPGCASAQAPAGEVRPPGPAPGLFVGFRAGYSNYTITGTEVDLHTQPGFDQLVRVPGVSVAAVVRQRLYQPLAAQAELCYVRQGGDFTRRAFPGKTDYTVDCLQVPLLLDLRLGGATGPALHLQAGPAFVAVFGDVRPDASSFAPGNRFNNPTTWWAQAYGAELAWARAQRVYTLTARFTQDLTDYYQRDYAGTPYHARSHGYSLTAGVLFAPKPAHSVVRQ
ncbi:porin family protein [Hymenobacter sp. UYCo722]|uniref:porin family protein n=1 Tax=Hymenobacter sp. UYCo722 TaxID=3156335 RepID=UPI00339B6A73